MALKVTSAVAAHGPIPYKDSAVVNVSVEFDGPIEALTISVIVPNKGTSAEIEKRGMLRAKMLLQKFVDFPNGQ